MAGGAREPAETVPRGAVRLSKPVGDLSHGNVVRILLRVMLVLVALGTFVGAVGAPEVNGAFGLGETAMGVLFCVVIALLLVVNRLGTGSLPRGEPWDASSSARRASSTSSAWTA